MTFEKPYLLPLVDSKKELAVDWDALRSLIGHHSVIDSGVLRIATPAEARQYLLAYGFDLTDPDDRNLLDIIRQQTIQYIESTVLPYESLSVVPQTIKGGSMEEILMRASSGDEHWPYWPCVFLKVMHCAIHARFSLNPRLQHKALLKMKSRIQGYLNTTLDSTLWIGDRHCQIPLHRIDFKEEKAFDRLMTKLLHKDGNLAMMVADHIGVRFVTHTRYAAVLLCHFLSDRHIVCSANVVPERSKNSLASEGEARHWFDEVPEAEVVAALSREPDFKAAEENPHSADEFKMLKFVERVMVKQDDGRRTFYPFEVQIYDKDTWNDIQSGAGSHEQYRKRQMESVWKRLFVAKE
jgi:uncharacterized protein (TIGR04562 family)